MSRGTEVAGAQAVVTGGGSGIGAALTRALVAAGASVVCADLDLAAAEAVSAAATGPGTARAVALDVTDAAAVRAVVDDVVATAGRIDLLFNNAGITWAGDTELLTLEQWDAIVDVNIRGVVHGVHAAYPHLVRQRRGHIVNTASMGGLVAGGLITSYCMTKHAVVGLSLALRSEAVAHGVGVLAVCPAAVETPILEKGVVGRFVGRDYYLSGQGIKTPLDPDDLARQVLDAVRRGDALLVAPRRARLTWLVSRLAPRWTNDQAARFVARQRAAAG
ncbi:SDR family oxidoreductase [Nocardioides sp. SYSU D00038]|uniref:SDR family NAD(P)-dependent oxidoreductase n=1 Tax=Nocardioides sp. SYSU D00038 TaxID=2812554 RepID=UPI001967DA79|nr:SDR family oxidoreductase [Nocardioides sp. SYSU D00038]